MCGVCGCGGEGARVDGEHVHVDAEGREVRHSHPHDHGRAHGHGLRFRVQKHHHHHPHAHDGETRRIEVEEEILAKNDQLAAKNRELFSAQGTLAVNLMSSPGAGKTTLLVRTLEELGGGLPLGVIEGDQETSLDAERIRRTGVAALQVNTGRGCHLDASMVARASQGLEVHGGILFIENVGNLVCPAGFDLGEAKRVVIASVTEGEDKPAKYPHMFAGADLVIINKLDLLPYVPIDLDILELGIARVAPEAKILELSAVTGKGFDAWLTWLHDAWAALPRAAE